MVINNINRNKKNVNRINPKVKDVLTILGVGILVTGSLILPGFAWAAGEILKDIDKNSFQKYTSKELEKYDWWRFRQILKRLQDQKVVTIESVKEGTKITLTQKGRKRVLCFNLEKMKIKRPVKWDGRWRVIIYDVPKKKRHFQANFRDMLKKLKFLRIQNSVYLTPYPCGDEIEFLREYFQIPKNIIYMVVEKIENDTAYKKYFNLI